MCLHTRIIQAVNLQYAASWRTVCKQQDHQASPYIALKDGRQQHH